MNRTTAASLAALAAALAITTPASAALTIFAASDATTNSIGYTNQDTYTDTSNAATTVSHSAVAPATIHGTYTAAQVGKTITVKAVTVVHPAVTTNNPDGTTTTSAYTSTTTAGYSYKVTAAGTAGTGTATKTVPAYLATTAGASVVHKLSGNAGVLSNISNVSTGAYAGSTLTNFSFLNNALASSVNSKASYFTLTATSSTQATSTTIPGFGTFLTQPLLTGTFQFLSATAFNIGNYHVSVGDVFLSGSFSGAGIGALLNGSTASILASSAAGNSVTFNDSAFLNFTNVVHTDATFNMNAIGGGVGVSNSKSSLKSFTSSGSTQFASDPTPLVALVPEPAMWGLLVVGFGMVGFQTRRRHRATSVTA
ncbi:PEP-CTERM sorting domain-containing protein [Glacieibacterium megasporae]|uniref:PEP-CTERM sorting domain-containing protein n=1 Tax=Glacieibacterium megasporae TaxID=2835787 RepID=UPI001C1E13CD|nr:PEP-CTERM sorting domain-containing protein [Polymorphobacter megasporae]UAJ10369.1 hypothetical protein KTC28_00950 [Polymorphobacter megasporae]